MSQVNETKLSLLKNARYQLNKKKKQGQNDNGQTNANIPKTCMHNFHAYAY